MKIKKYFVSAVLFLCSFFAFTASTETNIKGLYRKTLDNGLEVFVMENNSAPLAYIEIAIRGGAVSQTPETAGLFHLYEHLMFKGNAKYPNQDAFKKAMNRLGVGAWNGTTGVDRVNYFFTVPSSVVRDGIEFWSYAVRSPKIDNEELEREKGVVLSEINGKLTNPSVIAGSALFRTIFHERPWKVDTGGNPEAIQNATVEQLKKIQSEFYVPENAALFVGGDVKHDEIFKYVKEIFGDWKQSSSSAEKQFVPSKKIADETVKLVFADSSSSDAFIAANYYLRGPDGETESSDTYAADVWGTLVNDPDGIATEILTENKKLSIPDAEYCGASYYTQRASGRISFSAYMMNDGNPVEKSQEFLRVINEDLVKQMLDENSTFTEKIANAEQRLADSRIYELETARGILSSLSFYFASCGADYFLGYDENISKVTAEAVRAYIRKYIEGKNGVLLVNVSPKVFEEYKDDFEKNGFQIIKSEEAFWWKK